MRPVFHLVDPVSVLANRVVIDKRKEHLPANPGEVKEIFMKSALTWNGTDIYTVTGIVMNPSSNIITLEIK